MRPHHRLIHGLGDLTCVLALLVVCAWGAYEGAQSVGCVPAVVEPAR